MMLSIESIKSWFNKCFSYLHQCTGTLVSIYLIANIYRINYFIDLCSQNFIQIKVNQTFLELLRNYFFSSSLKNSFSMSCHLSRISKHLYYGCANATKISVLLGYGFLRKVCFETCW